MDTPQKRTVRPSIRNTPVAPVVANTPAPTVNKDLVWYLKSVCGGQDKYEFDTPEEAYKFGWDLREKHGEKIRVEISVNTVRVFSV